MDLINTPAFATHINDLLHQWHVPGLAVAIVQNSTIASKGFGMASLNPPSYVTADTLFDIASSSKSLTAASVGLLATDNVSYPQLQWDTPMSHLLPDDFVMSGDGYTEQVTVEDILSHRSGFPRHDLSYFGERSEVPDTPQSVTRNLRNLPNTSPPRTKFIYSNIMFIVASWLVEKLSGLSFADYLHKHIFEPLEMNFTHLQPNAAIDAGLRHRMATPYVWDNGSFRAIPFIQAPEAQGCGSIFTSVNDFVLWVRALMNQEPPISKQLYEDLIRQRMCEDAPDETSCYAAGLGLYEYHGVKLVGHTGYDSGYGSMFFFLPDLKFGGVILANSGGSEEAWGTYVANLVAAELVDEILKKPGVEKRDDIAGQKLFSPPKSDNEHNTREAIHGSSQPSASPHGTLQHLPLGAYTGRYCHPGYRCLLVSHKADALFIDATDRSQGFTVTFERDCSRTACVAHFTDYWEGGDEETTVEFEIMGQQAVRMGIGLEIEMMGPIWFERMRAEGLGILDGGQTVLGGL